jgi:hypothetical protein
MAPVFCTHFHVSSSSMLAPPASSSISGATAFISLTLGWSAKNVINLLLLPVPAVQADPNLKACGFDFYRILLFSSAELIEAFNHIPGGGSYDATSESACVCASICSTLLSMTFKLLFLPPTLPLSRLGRRDQPTFQL